MRRRSTPSYDAGLPRVGAAAERKAEQQRACPVAGFGTSQVRERAAPGAEHAAHAVRCLVERGGQPAHARGMGSRGFRARPPARGGEPSRFTIGSSTSASRSASPASCNAPARLRATPRASPGPRRPTRRPSAPVRRRPVRASGSTTWRASAASAMRRWSISGTRRLRRQAPSTLSSSVPALKQKGSRKQAGRSSSARFFEHRVRGRRACRAVRRRRGPGSALPSITASQRRTRVSWARSRSPEARASGAWREGSVEQGRLVRLLCPRSSPIA